MSEQKQKVYVNGMFVKTQQTNYGPIIKISCKVEDVIKFLQDNQSNGWVDIDLLQKREVDEKGRTHTAVLNDWKPTGQKPAQAAPQLTAVPAGNDDLPF